MNPAMTFDPKIVFMGRVNTALLQREGGTHLGAMRGRIQTMFSNGESVTWSSRDVLSPPATVKNLEELASVVAESVLNNIQTYMPRNNVFQQLQTLKTACEQALKAPDEATKILTNALAKTVDCICGNTKHNFDCTCAWSKLHPGDREFTCEFCGLYTASKPRCNKCKEER